MRRAFTGTCLGFVTLASACVPVGPALACPDGALCPPAACCPAPADAAGWTAPACCCIVVDAAPQPAEVRAALPEEAPHPAAPASPLAWTPPPGARAAHLAPPPPAPTFRTQPPGAPPRGPPPFVADR